MPACAPPLAALHMLARPGPLDRVSQEVDPVLLEPLLAQE